MKKIMSTAFVFILAVTSSLESFAQGEGVESLALQQKALTERAAILDLKIEDYNDFTRGMVYNRWMEPIAGGVLLSTLGSTYVFIAEAGRKSLRFEDLLFKEIPINSVLFTAILYGIQAAIRHPAERQRFAAQLKKMSPDQLIAEKQKLISEKEAIMAQQLKINAALTAGSSQK